MRAAARFVREHTGLLPAGAVPRDPPRLAVLAVMASDAFLGRAGVTGGGAAGGAAASGAAVSEPPGEPADEELARRVLDAARGLMLEATPPDTC